MLKNRIIVICAQIIIMIGGEFMKIVIKPIDNVELTKRGGRGTAGESRY